MVIINFVGEFIGWNFEDILLGLSNGSQFLGYLDLSRFCVFENQNFSFWVTQNRIVPTEEPKPDFLYK